MTSKTKQVTIHGKDGVMLSGTLVLPAATGPAPAALLLSGSGPLDRDSNTPGQRLDISSTLATALGVLGIATLRFDKRGVAASPGDFAATGFHDETADAAAALKTLRGFDAINPARVGLIGHSVGATIAARLAAADPAVAFVALLGCATTSGADVMDWQTERIATGLPGPSWLLRRRFQRKQIRVFHRIETSESDTIRIGEQEIPAKWMREYRAYEPAADLGELRCPVLAITGGKDVQVDPAAVSQIAAAVNGPCTALVPADLTHVLRSTSLKPSIARYPKLLREPVDAQLVETVSNWAAEQSKPGANDPSGGIQAR